MSQAALALLAGDDAADGEIPQTASERAIALLDGTAEPASEPKKTPSLAMAPVGGAEMLLRRATGLVAGIPAGIAYGGAAVGKALGLNTDPRATMADVQEYFTYDPLSESGKAGEEQLGRAINMVAAPVGRAFDRGASAVGVMSPTAETFLREAPAAAAAAGGVLGLSPLAAPATAMLRATPGAIASGAKTAASGAAAAGSSIVKAGESASDAVVRALGGEVRQRVRTEAEADPLLGFGADTASAAAASRINAVKSISPELVQDLRAQIRRGPLNPEAVDRQIDADALPIRMRLMEGQASKDPEVWSREFNSKGKDPAVAARFNEQNQQLIDNLDEFRRQAAPQAVAHDPVQSGQSLVDAYKNVDNAATEEINAAYKAARDANGGDLPMDGQSFASAADAALKKNLKARYLPKEIAADLAEIRESGSMNFELFDNMRTNLAAEGRKAERASDGNAAAAINLVRDALEKMEPIGRVAEVKPLFDNARSLARTRFDKIKADPAYKAAINDDVGVGESSPLADKFVQKYIVGAPRAHVERLMGNLAGDDLALETVRAAPFNYLKQKAGIDPYRNEGNFSQHGYNRALAELMPKLDLLAGEELAEQAQRLGRVAYDVKGEPAGSFPNRSNTFIASTAEAAKGLAERGANTLIGGNIVPVGSWAREKLDARTVAREQKERMRPAAGTLAKEKKP